MEHRTPNRPEATDDPSANDSAAGFEILDDFEPFNQRDDILRRSRWDERIRNEKTALFYAAYRSPLKTWRAADGFTQNDYAIRNAAWHISDIFTDLKEDQDRREGFNDEYSLQLGMAEERVDLGSPANAAAAVKRVAKGFGADLVGITTFDKRWMYANKFSDLIGVERPQEIPDGMTSVVVTAMSMDYDMIRTVPSALSGAATGLGYSHDAAVTMSIAQYLRNLGYNAIASMNDTSLGVPLAIKAGLGEYGRLGLLITKEFGPRVRIGKIYTDLPLDHDEPIRFGVKEFCDICHRCAQECPVNAIPDGEPSTEVHNQSNIRGVRKWSMDAEKCFGYWAAQNTDCSICIRVCPYNKDYSAWWHRVARWIAGTPLRCALHWLDIKMGYGKRMAPRDWWKER